MGASFGILLAGGLARRMGGGDKPLLEIGGRPIIAHAIERLGPQCAGLVVNANGDPARFAAFGLPVAADRVEGFAGPLAGVLAGMDHVYAGHPEATDIVTAPADTPFLPTDLVKRLYEARKSADARIAVAASGGRVHHAVALWPVSLREELRRALMEEEVRKVAAFIARYPNVTVEWPVEPYDPFFNVNRPEDVGLASAIVAG
ncbi:molybdenum cofactor guanylyltransferase MobA [Methylocystis parvus]|uniref:Molybdenum cofactor guanylyltransferase n=1 Tax=Methylocystis parvus TaxID=134 RepID=A0A6B8M4M8_9HYPH|nr:molybdenum cofactor guanylyltransferase MobA [Methylocystis parvus]QGM98884.1 molybdenum cofactor guanylyltransferase MobA [Methylocystis parvus]WBK00760.1 molybdenum cofactor guanylyltransferase MobA [Methylocystis parvus OBBP]